MYGNKNLVYFFEYALVYTKCQKMTIVQKNVDVKLITLQNISFLEFEIG